MRLLRKAFWAAVFIGGPLILYLIIEDMPAYDRSIFFELMVGIVIPLILFGFGVGIVALIILALFISAIVYIIELIIARVRGPKYKYGKR